MVILNATAHRLIRWGMNEREALLISKFITLSPDATDAVVEDTVIRVLVAAAAAAGGDCTVELVSGERRDILPDNTQLRLK